MKKGFTLLEIILVVLIMSIIAVIIVRSLSLFNRNISLKSDVAKIASLVYKARTDTLADRGGMQYGIHFESGKVVLFQGSSYSSGAATNQNYSLNRSVSISAISLTGGGNEVIFQKLTGVTAEPGSITISSNGAGTGAGTTVNTISISSNGIVSVQ